MYLQDRDGDENWHVNVDNVETAETRDLTPYDGVQALPQPPSELFPDEVLIGVNRREPRLRDLYRVNILTGETQLVVSNDFGAVGFGSDTRLRGWPSNRRMSRPPICSTSTSRAAPCTCSIAVDATPPRS